MSIRTHQNVTPLYIYAAELLFSRTTAAVAANYYFCSDEMLFACLAIQTVH